jgi:hypothetical protein
MLLLSSDIDVASIAVLRFCSCARHFQLPQHDRECLIDISGDLPLSRVDVPHLSTPARLFAAPRGFLPKAKDENLI